MAFLDEHITLAEKEKMFQSLEKLEKKRKKELK